MSFVWGRLIHHLTTQKQQECSGGKEHTVWFISLPLDTNSTSTFKLSAFKHKSPKILRSTLSASWRGNRRNTELTWLKISLTCKEIKLIFYLAKHHPFLWNYFMFPHTTNKKFKVLYCQTNNTKKQHFAQKAVVEACVCVCVWICVWACVRERKCKQC